MRRLRTLGHDTNDPLEGVANFFDLGVVFALAFMVSLISYLGLPELLQNRDLTLVKNPGSQQMEIIRKRGVRITRYRISRQRLRGEGEKLGTAYRLRTGEVIYVPED